MIYKLLALSATLAYIVMSYRTMNALVALGAIILLIETLKLIYRK